jgi:hypothetical protein
MFVEKLANSGKYYFLSRPRRFGKSLFLDTLKQAFLGNKKVFEGLYLEKHWDWSITYPVIHISYGANDPLSNIEELKSHIIKLIKDIAEKHGITIDKKDSYPDQFKDLIVKLNEKYNQKVVVLIDEYDKPILDAIEDTEKAERLRDVLKGFYGTMKDLDAYLKFVFLTGVSKFAKAGIFIGLNNLTDISMDAPYASLCGITQEELNTVYAEPIQALAQKESLSLEDCLTRIKIWYNGYRFTKADISVYNPFSTLSLFSAQEFRNHWFQTGTPSFLIKLMLKEKYAFKDLENSSIEMNDTSTFDIGNLDLTQLLFQTGYLTIKEVTKSLISDKITYQLKMPNAEVRESFCSYLLGYLYPRAERNTYSSICETALVEGKPELLEKSFKGLLASLPHHWYTNNKLQHYEGFYCSVIYAFVVGMGLDVTPEDVTNYGRIDFTIKALEKIFIFEFKVIDEDDTDVSALQQIKDKNYAEKYRSVSNMIYLIGVHFSKADRNVVGFEWEKMA